MMAAFKFSVKREEEKGERKSSSLMVTRKEKILLKQGISCPFSRKGRGGRMGTNLVSFFSRKKKGGRITRALISTSEKERECLSISKGEEWLS